MKTHRIHLLVFLVLLFTTSCGETPPAARTPVPESVDAPEEQTIPIDRSVPEEETEPKQTQTDTGPLAQIRADYERISQQMEAGDLREETKTFRCENDPGEGELIRFYDGKELVVMALSQGGEHSWTTETIYFKDNQPFFVLEEDGNWQFGGPLDEESPNTIDQITETRYYLSEGIVIQKLTKSFAIKSWEDSPESHEVPNEVVKVPPNTVYPKMAAIPQMKRGNVGC